MPGPIGEEERSTMGGTIGITQAQFSPEVKFDTYAKGKASGTARGAAEGFLSVMSQLGHCSGDFCAVAALFWIATAGTAGAVHGAITGYRDAIPAEEAERIESSTRQLLNIPSVQKRMAECLAQTARLKTGRSIVMPDIKGPAEPGEKIDYTNLKNRNVGSVLEVSVRQIAFETPPRDTRFDRKDPPLHLALSIDARTQRTADGKVLYRAASLKAASPHFRKAEWEADKSRKFFEEADVLIKALAEKIVDDVFLTIELPMFGGESQ